MTKLQKFDKMGIDMKCHKLLALLLNENPQLEVIIRKAKNETEALIGVRNWILPILKQRPDAYNYYKRRITGREAFNKLAWSDYAAIRILDYVDNAGRKFEDLNLKGKLAVSNPIKLIWLATTYGVSGAKVPFFEDMLYLFRQFNGTDNYEKPSKETVKDWMNRHPSGLDARIIALREENKERIISAIINKIDRKEIEHPKYQFDDEMSQEQKFLQVIDWWEDYKFHLTFAIRNSRDLNEMLGKSLTPEMLKLLQNAEKVGIPFFVNPYYLSLLQVRIPEYAIGADLAIRDYVLYSKELVKEFGEIIAWEKEDEVEPGKPNAAGWMLPPYHNVHRRYPEVSILVPDTVGRACGGLCASCQRMFDFQNGHLNFNLDKLNPTKKWDEKLEELMDYFEKDSQLRDILITGGDGLMSSDKSLKKVLDAVYEMAVRKKEANKNRKEGEKYAEMLRIRIGSRLPAYLPQRITPELIAVLAEFKEKAAKIGFKQFLIQTHFQAPMEVTPEAANGIKLLISAGWTVTNQLVYTSGASRRGHTAQLRRVLNDIGVLTYYTFTVKGYLENKHNFATNARAVQEQLEEKIVGEIPEKYYDKIKEFPLNAENMVENIKQLRKEAELPFLATDRNVLNLPGVGKSLTFRAIGITRYGRRILEFDHDANRVHSPIIHKMGKVVIVESKTISEYLQQLDEMGEDTVEYKSLYGYSIGETEPRIPVYEYPEYDYKLTDKLTNLEVD